MAFLSMTVSIFTVVATVANNLNNNNNNINSNNLNFVQQKQNSLSMNQNIVNQIMVDLPPPVPGKRLGFDQIYNMKNFALYIFFQVFDFISLEPGSHFYVKILIVQVKNIMKT